MTYQISKSDPWAWLEEEWWVFMCVVCRQQTYVPESEVQLSQVSGLCRPKVWFFGDICDLAPNILCPFCYTVLFKRPIEPLTFPLFK